MKKVKKNLDEGGIYPAKERSEKTLFSAQPRIRIYQNDAHFYALKSFVDTEITGLDRNKAAQKNYGSIDYKKVVQNERVHKTSLKQVKNNLGKLFTRCGTEKMLK